MNSSPLAFWPLARDGHDAAGRFQATTREVEFTTLEGRPAAWFGGRGAIELAGGPDFGSRDFTISGWLYTRPLDGGGDLISQWDPTTRRGYTFTLQRHDGVTSAQPNHRHLAFGFDAGTEPRWQRYGRPGEAVKICSLVTWEGNLYAGTYEHGGDQHGHLYRWAGGESWVDCDLPTGANAVAGLAVHDGQLFAGTMRYNAEGSALGRSANEVPGGEVWRLDRQGTWTLCGSLPGAAEVLALCSHQGYLYAIPLYTDGVYRWDGATGWESCGVPGDRRAFALGTWQGNLFLASNAGPVSLPAPERRSGVFRYEGGTAWLDCGPQGDNTQTYSLVTWQGRLYAGTWPDGSVWRYDGEQAWSSAGRLGEEREVMPLVVFNGQLYGGTLPLAQVYRYAGGTTWDLVGRLDHTPDVTYRRVWSMAVHDGRLICGTLPSGDVWAMEAGACVTADHELVAGWRHVAAVRKGETLTLYVDGLAVATKPAPPLNVSTPAPLCLGAGPHAPLQGALAEVRLDGLALTAAEIGQLAAGPAT